MNLSKIDRKNFRVRNKLKKVSINRSGSFKPTDLSALPSGDIILLERSYTPIKGAAARISLIKSILNSASIAYSVLG